MSKENPKILLAEDDEFMILLVTQEFAKSGLSDVTVAKNGQEVVDKFKEARPDIMILDISMPIKSGLDALREVRALPGGKDVPVVMLSNFNDVSFRKQAEQLNTKAYLLKSDHLISEIIEKAKEVVAASYPDA